MSLERGFADIDKLLVALLEDLAGGAGHCGNETPADLQDRMPFIRPRKVDGSRDQIFDRPVVELHVFADLRSVAVPLADQVFELLMSRPAPHPAIDAVACAPAPREIPWGDGKIRCVSANYAFELRRTKLRD